MDKNIEADLYRYYQFKGFFGLLKGMMIPGFRYTYFFRKAHKYKKYSLKGIISRLILHWIGNKYGFQIKANAKIGKGFYIGHFGTIIIGDDVVIGSNCNITHNVTIGNAIKGKLKGVPTLGDNVWMGTGSIIIGKIQIGSNVLIAPNAFVNFNVPSNSTVIGNPARIIHMNNNPVDGYINDILDG